MRFSISMYIGIRMSAAGFDLKPMTRELGRLDLITAIDEHQPGSSFIESKSIYAMSEPASSRDYGCEHDVVWERKSSCDVT